MREAHAIAGDFSLSGSERSAIEDLIEFLLDALDQDAGDPDLEPSLGSACDCMGSGIFASRLPNGEIDRYSKPNLNNQEFWAEGSRDDRELVNEDGEDSYN